MKPPAHPRVSITLNDGRQVEAIAPLIISASRATDIPAFFPRWFIDSLNMGFVGRPNPFNGKIQYISYTNCRLIVFWSKNPSPMLPFLEMIERRGLRYFFHLTINDYEEEGFEPGLPSLDRRIETVLELSRRIGRARILWRFDPLILTSSTNHEKLLGKIERIGDRIAHAVFRLTVSFLSPYRSVIRRMKRRSINPVEPSAEQIDHIGAELAALGKKWGLEIVTCAESRDMKRWGIQPGSCIDPIYIRKIFNEDAQLAQLIESVGNNRFLDDVLDTASPRSRLKDPGQRPLCNCMISKDIGTYGTCSHNCIYCYAQGTPFRTGPISLNNNEAEKV